MLYIQNYLYICFNFVFHRSVNEINTLLNDLREKISEVEHQYGTMDNLREQLREKEEKYGVNIEFTSKLRESCEVSKFRIKLNYEYNFYRNKNNAYTIHSYILETH